MATSVMIVGRISVDGGPPRPAVMTGMADALGTWGGVAPPYVDIGLPGPQPPPLGFWGGVAPPYVDISPPQPQPPPLVIWGPNDPRPTQPIYWPGFPNWPPVGTSPTPPPDRWYWAYDEGLGWVLVPPGGGGKPQPVP
jgi:hypothetical protein